MLISNFVANFENSNFLAVFALAAGKIHGSDRACRCACGRGEIKPMLIFSSTTAQNLFPKFVTARWHLGKEEQSSCSFSKKEEQLTGTD